MYLIAKAQTDDTYFDDSGILVAVEVNRRLLNRLKKEATAVKRLRAYCVESFDLSVMFLEVDESDEDMSLFMEELDEQGYLIVLRLSDRLANAEHMRVETRIRHTTDVGAYWTAYPKHSNAELYHTPVPLKRIAAALK